MLWTGVPPSRFPTLTKLDPRLAHGLDPGQGFHPHALFSQGVSSGLEGFFDTDACSHKGGPGLVYFGGAPAEGGAGGALLIGE